MRYHGGLAHECSGCCTRSSLELKRMGAKVSNKTNYGRNALHVAAMKGLEDMVHMLLGMDKGLMGQRQG